MGLAAILLAVAATAPAGPASAAAFVGAALGDVTADQKVTIAHPQPVQLLFQFRTKGSPNLQATKQVKQDVFDAVKASGLFSEVGEGPVANGALLNVVIDNVVPPGEMADAQMKGALTGATFFVAGSNIREHYACSIDYVPGPNAAKITRTAEHSIVVQMGLINSTPTDAVKVDGGMKGAVSTMIRQIVSNPLNALAADPGFAPPAAPAAPEAPATVADPAPPAPTPVAEPAAKPTAEAHS